MSGKYVYFFGDGTAEGRGDMKNLLGGKGANLAEMTSIGLPVPAGFTLTTEVCSEFYDNDRNYPQTLEAEVDQHLARVETMMGKTFGFQADPGTIRGDFGLSKRFNLIHGSDSPESAEYEMGLYFDQSELVDYDFADGQWINGTTD